MNADIHSVLISIDCLLDSRLATLGIYSEEKAAELLISGKYHSRLNNKFNKLDSTISDTVLEEMYSTRGENILKQSRVTNIIKLLTELVLRYIRLESKVKELTLVDICINMYPYNCSPTIVEALVEQIAEITKASKVTSCFIHPVILTPNYLAQYNTVVMNDFDEWITMHQKEFNTRVLRNTEMYCPRVFIKDEGLDSINPSFPASELSLILAEYVQLTILPLSEFSVYKPD